VSGLFDDIGEFLSSAGHAAEHDVGSFLSAAGNAAGRDVGAVGRQAGNIFDQMTGAFRTTDNRAAAELRAGTAKNVSLGETVSSSAPVKFEADVAKGINDFTSGLYDHIAEQLRNTYDQMAGKYNVTADEIASERRAGQSVHTVAPGEAVLSSATDAGAGMWHTTSDLLNSPQNIYRLAMLAYRKGGWNAAIAALTPAVIGGIAGAATGGLTEGAVAPELASESAGLESTAATDAAATDAATTEAATGPNVAQQMYNARFAAARDSMMQGPVGDLARVVGTPFRVAGKMGSSPVLAGAQVPYAALYQANGPLGQMWKEAQSGAALEHMGLPGSLGQGLSKMVYGNQNTWLAGTTNAISNFIATPFMVGRAFKYSTRGLEGLRAVDSVAVDQAFNANSGYRRALQAIVDIGIGHFGADAEKQIAGAIVRVMPDLAPIAADLAGLFRSGEKITAYDVSKKIGELADAGHYTHSTNLPTTGLYGILKMHGKLSDAKIPSYFSRVLGQSPMSISELNKTIETGTIDLGDTQAAYKLGQLLQQTGMASRDITRIVDHLVNTQDLGEWENVVKSALKENFYQRIDRSLFKALNLDTPDLRNAFRTGTLSDEQLATLETRLNEPGLRDLYDTLRQAISDQVDNMVGSSNAGKSGLFGNDAEGRDQSPLNDGRRAAITENQSGTLHIPNYKTFDKEFAALLKKHRSIASGVGKYADMVGAKASWSADMIDSWVNDRFFKPLALLTPGWAIRVSLSELVLNTARLGPLNMAAGFLTSRVAKTEANAAGRSIYWAQRLVEHLSEREQQLSDEVDALQHAINDRVVIPQGKLEASAERDKLPAGYSPTTDTGDLQAELDSKTRELDALRSHIRYLNTPAAKASEPGVIKSTDQEMQSTITKYLGQKGYKLNPTQAQNLSMIVRGVWAGAKMNLLYGIGKDEFVKNAAYLINKHGGYLPPAADSIHKSIYNNIDWESEYQSVTKFSKTKVTDGVEIPGAPKVNKVIHRGTLKTKMVLMSPKDFANVAFGQKGYFEGWMYGANTIMGSEIGRPAAAAYLDLYKSGLRGKELHDAAVAQAEDIIKSAPESLRAKMARSTVTGAGHAAMTPDQSWAEVLVKRIEGISGRVDLQDATKVSVHVPLLEDIVHQSLPAHVNEFYKQYAFDANGKPLDESWFPAQVATRIPALEGRVTFLERLSSSGHAKVLGPMVNYLSRQPTFIAEYVNARKALDDAVARGSLTSDQADIMAETSATNNMVKYIHNPEDRTKFEESISWAAPFYFAQNQAMRRAGRLFAENPGAFMQYLYTLVQVQNVVNNAVSQSSLSLKTIPNFLLYGLPFTYSLSSLSTIDPFFQSPDPGTSSRSLNILDIFAPKFGPILTVPTKLLYWRFPKLGTNPVGKNIGLGIEGNIASGESLPQFLFQSALPNSVARNIVEGVIGATFAATGTGGNVVAALDNSYVQSFLEAIRYNVHTTGEQYWNYLGTKKAADELNGGQPITQQLRLFAFFQWQADHYNPNTLAGVDSIQNLITTARQHTWWLWLLKTTVGSLSPVSIGIGAADQKSIDTLQKMAKDPKYKGNYMAAVDAFTIKQPFAGIDTVAKSTSIGGYYPETQSTYNFLSAHGDLAQQYPLAVLAIAPDLSKDTKFYEPAHTLLLSLGLRIRDTPQDFTNQMLLQQGNAFYYDWVKPQYEQMRKSNKTAANQFRNRMIQWYGANHNTYWYNNFNAYANTTKKLQALQQFMDMTSPANKQELSFLTPEQQESIQILRAMYDAVMGPNGAYAALESQITSGKISSANASIWWQGKMNALIKQFPQAKQGIMTLFYNLG
jgi:hypothetical protein